MIPAHLEAGNGPALLFLHGVGGGAACFGPQLAHFGRNRRAIAWDMPGYGRSAALPAMTFPALADAAVRLLDALRIERADIVGHSMGGMVALELAGSHRDRLNRLILAGTSAAFGSADGSFQRNFLAERLGPLDAGRGMAELAPSLVANMSAPGADAAGIALAEAAMAAVPAEIYRQSLYCLTSFDRRSLLAELSIPTLIIAGEHDRAAPPAGMQRLADRIAGARFVCLEGSGHMLPMERPAAFNRALGAFLAED